MDMNETLEKLIDTHGLQDVLVSLSNICFEKAAHIRENWQDANLAKLWEKNAKVLDIAQSKLVATH